MIQIQVYDKLCIRDKRNPNNTGSFADPFATEEQDYSELPRVNCWCDNCFYGRDKLALEIIRLNKCIEDNV